MGPEPLPPPGRPKGDFSADRSGWHRESNSRSIHQMSDSPRRLLFVTLATFFLAAAAFATTPSGRLDARMVYDPATSHTILFGGATAIDPSTKQAYEFSDTWDWNGTIWTQLFPLHVPTARYGHVMVYDSARNRIVMFGGRTGNAKTDL